MIELLTYLITPATVAVAVIFALVYDALTTPWSD
jgi:hypothetical protein